VLVPEGGAAADAITVADAAIGGIAVTSDGIAALLFDPNPEINSRMWVAIARFGPDGGEQFSTDLFRSPNLEDEGTKGAPSSARFAYVPDSDELVAYFGHTQRYDDGVRHQGGYLAFVDASGTQRVVSGWYGSHNLEQGLLVDGARVAVAGVGDAFPKGIFFAYTDQQRLRANVVYPIAADGGGAANARIGGMLDLGEQVLMPFITNRSLGADVDPGAWPDMDPMISMQIREESAAGTDLGLLYVPKTTEASTELEPTWLLSEVASGARMGSLKSVRYGNGELVLLAWAETTGGIRDRRSSYFTMVIDHEGNVCQPKLELDAAHAFTAGDEMISLPDGRIAWGGVAENRIQVVTLTP
jgi:hypothetical protein